MSSESLAEIRELISRARAEQESLMMRISAPVSTQKDIPPHVLAIDRASALARCKGRGTEAPALAANFEARSKKIEHHAQRSGGENGDVGGFRCGGGEWSAEARR